MTNNPNRKERRKAKPKPLARLGVPIHSVIVAVVAETPAVPQKQFFWFGTEQRKEWTMQEIVETQELHGPFDTEAEAEKAAQIAIVGKDCEITYGGRWDPAWDKPQ